MSEKNESKTEVVAATAATSVPEETPENPCPYCGAERPIDPVTGIGYWCYSCGSN